MNRERSQPEAPVKLHTVFITYNRLELTKQAIASYLQTVSVPWTAWIVDNASSDGTREWILNGSGVHAWPLGSGASLLNENRYPGFACNLGFAQAPADATLLHRADNDFIFLAGWCNEVERLFSKPELGQLGLRTNAEELHNMNNVGGNCVIRRELWDRGLRYDERPWPQIREEVGSGWSEDGLLSPQVKVMGYRWGRVRKRCIQATASGDPSDPYYVQSLADRGVTV